MVNRIFFPRVGIDINVFFLVGRNLMIAARISGRIDNPGIVAAVREDEGDIGVRQHLDLVYGPPRRNVIGDGADGKDGSMNVTQGDGTPANLIATCGKVIVQEEMPEIFRVHPVRHAGCVRIPRHEIEHGLALAHEITVHDSRPDEVV